MRCARRMERAAWPRCWGGATDALLLQDLDGRIQAWNAAAQALYGWSEPEALALPALARIPNGLDHDHVARMNALRRGDSVPPFRSRRLCKDGSTLDVWVVSMALRDEQGAVQGIATIEQPASEANAGAVD